MSVLVKIGTRPHGSDVLIDIDRLVDTRLLLSANSGAGKSYAMRKILEGSFDAVQHHILDPEGEFHTLRDEYGYIVAGRPGGTAGDCPADPASAAVLARRVMELGVSIILDLSHLDWPGRQLFAKHYLDALMLAPRSLWRPALVVIDEAHKFSSERGEDDKVKSASSDSVVALMSQGRKRGLGGALLVQRLSRLRKSAAADANNVLIGRTGLDTDVKRAAAILGYDREQALALRKLPDGCFHAYGPAISDEVIEVQIGEVVTRHPKAGDVQPPPRAVSSNVAMVLAGVRAKLADVTEAAEAEVKTVATLTAKVADLERQLRSRKPAMIFDANGSPADPIATERAVQATEARLVLAHRQEINWLIGDIERRTAQVLVDTIRSAGEDALAKAPPRPRSPIDVALTERHPQARVLVPGDRGYEAPLKPSASIGKTDDPRIEARAKLTGPELRLLDSLAWWEAVGVTDVGVSGHAFMANYSPSSSSFTNARGSLRAKDLVVYGIATTTLTDAGRVLALVADVPRTNVGLQEHVMAQLDGPCQRVLAGVLISHPTPITKDLAANRARYSVGSSSFTNACGHLRSLGLVDYPTAGYIAATALLFPEGW